MIKSISAWAFSSSRPAEEVFQLARQHGFDGVEATIAFEGDTSQCFQVSPNSSREDCLRVREAAEKAGVQIVSVASGLGWKLPLSSREDSVRAQGIETTRLSLQVASWLGVDALLVVPGGVGLGCESPPTRYDVAYDNALSSLRELAPTAQEVGVTLAVENVWNKFLLSPLEMRDFLDALGSPRAGCYFDVGNVLINGYPEQWIEILGGRISRIHFKDWKRSVGTIQGFCPLLEGDVDFPAVVAALRSVGYNGAVTSEFFNCEGDLPAISRAMDSILSA